ncbi:ABC transporter substrate-binding protein [Gulosibacter sp. 10]|uniref:ABC transporter substrate-binding protein n=1 Tax=Gulosibacter sp. 10 TaxID=1255570 RepID=UPI00097EF2A1|nr:ABC transporter substrate-binding protein [Gulosibacter sp. 10]SJM71100.1 High-affinity leucine-specific transport system, periplasmic binding protein LivK (TC 3.A.1.4.1) [Gulosibacter sp. 10]
MSLRDTAFSRRDLFRFGGLASLAAIAGPSLAACASPGTTDDVLRIGVLMPLSGTNALLGQSSWEGVQMAVNERNERGGVGGKRLEVVLADVPDVNTAVSEARRLVFNNNIKLGLGTYGSALSTAASEVFARTGNSFVELGAVAAEITQRGYDRVYRINAASDKMTQQALRFAAEYLAPQLGKPPADLNVMMVYEDSNYGQSVTASAEAAATEHGITISEHEAYSAKQTDLSSTVARIKAAQPDVVVAVSYAADAVLLGRQMRDAGVKVGAFIGCGGGYTLSEFREALGDIADGVFDADFPQPLINPDAAPGIEEFLDRYQQAYGKMPDAGYPQVNYTGASWVFDMLDSLAGDDDPDRFHEAATSFKAPVGSSVAAWGYELDEHNQNTLADHYIMQWQDGELRTVFPSEVAVAEPQLITPFGA